MSYLKSLNWPQEIRNTILIFVFGGATIFLYCTSCVQDLWGSRYTFLFSGLMWVLLWQGNGHLSDYLSTKFSWLEEPVKRFIWGIALVIIYSPAAVYFLYLICLWTLNVRISSINDIALTSIGVTFVISFFLSAAQFLKNWKESALDAERLKKEQMAAQYDSLKSQVNPHFLFNSFNALTNLVYEDQDMAAKFIRQLSKVYRYVLDTRAKELVSLKTELEFLESYIFLQKIRFEDKLIVKIQLEGYEDYLVPPLALQMLFENAVKHNTIAKDEPLTVEVFIEDNYILVRNNLQKKILPKDEHTGMGLENIKARFEFLTNKKVFVSEENEQYKVSLPLLKIEDEGSNS